MTYVPQYSGGDIANMGIDFVGAFMYALTGQAGALAQIIVAGLIIAVLGGLIVAVLAFTGRIKMPKIG